jgi:ABC-type sugar transport system ATPase subunit
MTGRVDAGRLMIDGADRPLTLAEPVRPGPVTVGIRPEDMRPDTAGELAGTVRLVEHLGAETYVLIDRPEPAGSAGLCWRATGTPAVASADLLRLTVLPGRLHLFDPHSGNRL